MCGGSTGRIPSEYETIHRFYHSLGLTPDFCSVPCLDLRSGAPGAISQGIELTISTGFWIVPLRGMPDRTAK
jgi:hypothetical protein